MVADVIAVGSPDIVERAILGLILAGRCYFGWALVWPIQAVFVVRELLCDIGTPS